MMQCEHTKLQLQLRFHKYYYTQQPHRACHCANKLVHRYYRNTVSVHGLCSEYHTCTCTVPSIANRLMLTP